MAQRVSSAVAAAIAKKADRGLGNVTAAQFLAAGMAAGLGAVAVVDPHKFGAKGDAVGAGDGVVTNGTKLESGQYTFTAADVGKKIYLQSDGPAERSIVGIDGFRALLNTAAPNGSGYWLAGTDDTAAYDAAFAYAANNFAGRVGLSATRPTTFVRGPIPIGGIVRPRAGCGYIVGNSQAQYNAGRASALVNPRRVGLVSAGGGQYGSVFHLKPGSYGHMWANEGLGAAAYSDFITLWGITFECYGSDWNENGKSGVALHVAFDGYGKVDPYNRIGMVKVNNAREDGFIYTGRGELWTLDTVATYCRRYGHNLDGLADSRIEHPVSAGNDKTGLRVNGGGPIHIHGGKSFYNGSQGGTDHKNSANVVLTSDNIYTGITHLDGHEAQESRGSSLVVESAANIIEGFKAFDPGRAGLTSGQLPDVIAGIHLKGAMCSNNVFASTVVRPTLTNFGAAGQNWGSAGNAVHIDAFDGVAGGPQKNFGDIYTTQATTVPERRGIEYGGGFGAKGGAGTSNGKNTGLRVDGVACT